MARICGGRAGLGEEVEVEDVGAEAGADIDEDGSLDEEVIGEEASEEVGTEVCSDLEVDGSGEDDDGLKYPLSDPVSSSRKKRKWKRRVYGSSDSDDEELKEEDIWDTQSLDQCSAGVCINASLKFSDPIHQDSSASDLETISTEQDEALEAMGEEERNQGSCPPAGYRSAGLSALQTADQSADQVLLLAQNSVFIDTRVDAEACVTGVHSTSSDSGIQPAPGPLQAPAV